LLPEARLDPPAAAQAQALARRLAEHLRQRKTSSGRAGIVQGLLQEYALSSQEGVALMCLAEALLRVPDAATRDALIRDKIARGEWQSHAGRSPSLFVNAATWGLLLTGKLVATHSETGLLSGLTRLIRQGGEPLIRKGVDIAMRIMGEQFVAGENIESALDHARSLEAQGFRYSYDMLGEAAVTEHDAARYRAAYESAIRAIGTASGGRGVYDGPGISIKLSALHPRYSRAQRERVLDELYPTLLDLALQARRFDIGLNIDAEEADRLELSLDMLEKLCLEPALANWQGIGFVVQAYQKRCPPVVDFIIDLARRSGHRLMVRLVKGAYWDSEIKRAQVDGLDGYPVYTRKAHTDVSYLACARKLLAAPDEIYPQFATHNAHTLAAIYRMADPDRYWPRQYEFQCLHGMGEPLYEQVVGRHKDGKLERACRIYAPVGTHETLLAYLVRRLLENGANSSFVNRIADPTLALDVLVEDPTATVEAIAAVEGAVGLPHAAIPLPRDIYIEARANSRGFDLSNEDSLRELQREIDASGRWTWSAEPLLDEAPPRHGPVGSWLHVLNPADHGDVVGEVREATLDDVERAIVHAEAGAGRWAAVAPGQRAAALERAADSLEADMLRLLGLLAREAGKTYANGIAEVREAVDFLRFYAAQARSDFDNSSHRPLGPMVCISPWNFPLAIFMGQVAAALAAGNTVLAKPAEQTPLIAAEAVRALWKAGVPSSAVQLLPGRGETIGAALVADKRIQGVLFTGSTAVARLLQKTLARRLNVDGKPVPFIAETGGQNAMIVDSTALTEQVVTDVMTSAFDSAGQRCSALRLLCVQEDAADRLIDMLKGAMAQCSVGNPAMLSVDVGPVIDAEARDGIEQHVARMRSQGHAVHRASRPQRNATSRGTFVEPTLIELDNVQALSKEIFGPVLHVVRFDREALDSMVTQINQTGYGLTLGVHTRIDETIARIVARARAGNVYVNRNIVGAVVGVQPFGGEGLSGTGPKAGGPLYMVGMLSKRPDDVLCRVFDPSGSRNNGWPSDKGATNTNLSLLAEWARRSGKPDLARLCSRFSSNSRSGHSRTLAGPTGEQNVYTLLPRPAVLSLADVEADRLIQLAAILAVGSTAVWPATPAVQALLASLPSQVSRSITSVADWTRDAVSFDVVLHHGDERSLKSVMERVAARPGPIVRVLGLATGRLDVALESLVVERALSVNTAAAGGNASLMTIE
jgi:RHH-type proline utilization regulon transcriptional repressor/proline dehydrogenase/delta 1-pyrroline-5-carboxylate dehydrogenase